MFSSIKFKILFFITIVMVFTAGINIFFTHKEVGNAMLDTQKQSVRKILEYVRLNTKEEYKRLLADKTKMTIKKKAQLKQTAMLILSVFESYDSIAGEKTDSNNTKKTLATAWIETAPFQEFNCFILDNKAQLVYSSIPELNLAGQEDIKGRILTEVMQYDNLLDKGGYAVVKSDLSSKLIYFVPFPKWKYTIGTTIDIDDIEIEAQDRLNQIIVSLNAVSKQSVGFKGGYTFMFNGELEFLIAPPEHTLQGLKSGLNRDTKNPILKDMMKIAKADNKKLIYTLADDPLEKQMTTSLSYFKNLDWYIGVTIPLDEIKRPAQELVFKQSLIIALILALSLIIIRVIVVRIASPLKLLATHAKNLPNQDFTIENDGENLIKKLPAQYNDEIGELAASFIFMEAELKENIKNLIQETEARQKIQSELNVAKEIQMGIIPKIFPTFPEYDEFDLFATLKPAREVGGDLYDFFLLDDDNICFALGDVSDKGVPAALFMVITQTLIKTSAKLERSPGAMMSNINNLLAADNPRSMFVTLIIGVFNFRTGHITYANGGHNPPVFIPAKQRPYFKEAKIEPVVGVMEGLTYSDISIKLEPDDCFLLYTDGVTEAMNSEEECFSNEKLLKTTESCKEQDINVIVDNIMAEIMVHKDTAPQSDDIAMLIIKSNA